MNLYAYTAATGAGYPEYLSVNRAPNGVSITVRGAANPDGSEGACATVQLTRNQFIEMVCNLTAAVTVNA